MHRPKQILAHLPSLALLASLVPLAGCGGMPHALRSHSGTAYYAPRNFTGDPVLPTTLRRVLVLPVAGAAVADPETEDSLDPILRAALQRQARFEVVGLSREECRVALGAPEFSSAAALPSGFLEKLGRLYSVDAVMFVDVTLYQPYGTLALGFRAKLAGVAGAHLYWSFDESFSAADPAVVNSVRRFSADQGGAAGTPAGLGSKVLQSPGRLAAFAADAMFATLPPR